MAAQRKAARRGVAMALVLGVVALVVVVGGVAAVLVMAGRQARDETGPESEPGDFVAPVSSGGYRWRQTDETIEQFQERIARENAAAPTSQKR